MSPLGWSWVIFCSRAVVIAIAYAELVARMFVGVTAVGAFGFAEPVSARKVAGLMSIVVGLYIISTA